MGGYFSEIALDSYRNLVIKLQGADFAEGETYDFTRCVKPDGTVYGTAGQCRKGTEEAKGEVPPRVREMRVGKTVKSPSVGDLEKLLGDPRVKPHQAAKIQKLIDEKKGSEIPPKPKEPTKPKIGGELVGDTTKLTGGLPRKSIEEKIKELNEYKKKHPKPDEYLDFELERLNKELNKFKTNEKILSGMVDNVPAGTKVFVSSPFASIVTEVTTKSGHRVKTEFGRKHFDFKVNGKYDAGTVTQRGEQIEVANTVRRTYEALVKSLPEGAVVTTKAWTEDGRGQSRMDAYVKMGFSRPKTTKDGEEIDGPPGMNQYAKKSNGKMVPSTSSEASLDQTYMFKESSREISLWHTVIFGAGLKTNKPGFFEESLKATPYTTHRTFNSTT
jgi:hypothetical protein